jgi:hypothetical protein
MTHLVQDFCKNIASTPSFLVEESGVVKMQITKLTWQLSLV